MLLLTEYMLMYGYALHVDRSFIMLGMENGWSEDRAVIFFYYWKNDLGRDEHRQYEYK